jgi:hypothetical protein
MMQTPQQPALAWVANRSKVVKDRTALRVKFNILTSEKPEEFLVELAPPALQGEIDRLLQAADSNGTATGRWQ